MTTTTAAATSGVAIVSVRRRFGLDLPLRDFFELVSLPLTDFALIGALAALWAVAVMVLWRTRAVDRVRNLFSREPASEEPTIS